MQGWGTPTPEDICYLFNLKKNPPDLMAGNIFITRSLNNGEENLRGCPEQAPELQEAVLFDMGYLTMPLLFLQLSS